jgi:2-oxo-4-hydroxy-4-carboxy--5-ureidoimidazoline (OHCU) decarboxylase
MEKFQVIFVPDAEKELSELINSHPELEGLALRYAKELSDFPPGKWVDVHFKNGGRNL